VQNVAIDPQLTSTRFFNICDWLPLEGCQLKIQFGDLSTLDLAALAYFVIAWLGYAPFIRWREKRSLGVGIAMVDHRREWMDALLGRDMKVADTAIVGHIMSTASFFASTTVIVIAGLLGVLINAGKSAQGAIGAWLAIPMPNALQIKIGLVVVIAYYAFQSFTWAIRQANFAAVMMGAAPPAASLDIELRRRLAVSMGSIITGVAASYDSGMRAYYFALGGITWIVSPILFILVTTGVVALLQYRQTNSRTALALKEIAEARSDALKRNEATTQTTGLR
jgi:uncharacterized membrane protein